MNLAGQGFGAEILGKNDFEDLGVDGRIKLKWIFRSWDWEAWIRLI
jgi:hypothetical protein